MIFSSIPFIFAFLPISLVVFWISAKSNEKLSGLWLIAASIVFYGYWRLTFIPMLIGSIAFNYLIGIMLIRLERYPRAQSALLFTGISIDIAALFYFKYAVGLASFFGFESLGGTPFWEIILPLGISFFTFTQIGYLIDVKQGVAKTRDLLSYTLFVTFFPHLIAGPILHNREMMPQFADANIYRFSRDNLAIGLAIFSIGLVKKVALADPLAADVAINFTHTEFAGFTTAWYAVIGYSLQLYFDFSGYSDMAIGLARMFNVRFPLNFNSPYKATTMIDYWQRFHITLTRFITMYIFSPIALNITRWRDRNGYDNSRRASARPGGFISLIAFPTLVTMALAGVWHGAGSQYFIFGVLHGIYITVNHASRIFFPSKKSAKTQSLLQIKITHVFKVLSVYIAALVAFAFFRAESTGSALYLVAGMIGRNGFGMPIPSVTLIHLSALFFIIWFSPNTQQIMSEYEPALGRIALNPYGILSWMPSLHWGMITGILMLVGILALGGTTEFLYFQF